MVFVHTSCTLLFLKAVVLEMFWRTKERIHKGLSILQKLQLYFPLEEEGHFPVIFTRLEHIILQWTWYDKTNIKLTVHCIAVTRNQLSFRFWNKMLFLRTLLYLLEPNFHLMKHLTFFRFLTFLQSTQISVGSDSEFVENNRISYG